ncbi:MAG: LptF/LptG family permease, partial [Pseudomonadales bacterium]|nr:LptF/LptG family permease [Pseudomonadales bacterium]
VVYARALSQDKTQMEKLFIYQGEKDKNIDGSVVVSQILLTAESGVRRVDPVTGDQYLELRNGFRYEGSPGRYDYHKMAFESYRYRLEKASEPVEVRKLKSRSSTSLFGSTELKEKAELQWRLSMPVLVFIVAMMAIPLSKVNPRQGRFLKLIPSIMLYLTYVLLLVTSQKWVEKGEISPLLGLWWVHGLFFVIALLMLLWSRYQFSLRQLWVRR